MSRLTALRSLSISGGPYHAPAAPMRRLGWWQLPAKLTALGLAWFDLSDPGTEEWHADGSRCVGARGQRSLAAACSSDAVHAVNEHARLRQRGSLARLPPPRSHPTVPSDSFLLPSPRMAAHFADLHSLRLQCTTLPRALLPTCAPVLADKLHSLSLVDVDGSSLEDLQCLSQLTALSTLRLLPQGHGIGGLDKLVPLRLKQLKLRCAPGWARLGVSSMATNFGWSCHGAAAQRADQTWWHVCGRQQMHSVFCL
jgi:hypothetical protein